MLNPANGSAQLYTAEPEATAAAGGGMAGGPLQRVGLSLSIDPRGKTPGKTQPGKPVEESSGDELSPRAGHGVGTHGAGMVRPRSIHDFLDTHEKAVA